MKPLKQTTLKLLIEAIQKREVEVGFNTKKGIVISNIDKYIQMEKDQLIEAHSEGIRFMTTDTAVPQPVSAIWFSLNYETLLHADVVDIDLQAAAVQSEPKPIDPDHLYPHMQYGLPEYYAVMFKDVKRNTLDMEAVNRYNKIHNLDNGGRFKFYGFDGKADCWDAVSYFAEPVQVLSVREFLACTDVHINPTQK